ERGGALPHRWDRWDAPLDPNSERVAVPRQNLVPMPPSLSFAEAACLPTAYLTAYRMLFIRGAVVPGQTVLIQGAARGVASAAIALARAAGIRVWATSRDERKRAYAEELGAHQAFETLAGWRPA